MNTWSKITNWAQDVRYVLRQLRQAPAFTLTIIVTLALGIGANTAMFTLVQAVLLRSLPVHNAAQLVRIGDTGDCCVEGGYVSENGDFDIFSYDMYQRFRRYTPEFEQLAAVQAGQGTYAVRRGDQPAEPMGGEIVSGNYFSTLGLRALAGRAFTDADDQPGAAPVTVLSYDAWQGQFGGARDIIGSTLAINTHAFTVIGVAPRGFFGDRVSDRPPDFWVPIGTEPLLDAQPGQSLDETLVHEPDANWLYPMGLLRPGTSIAALDAKLSTELRTWLATRPEYTEHGAAGEIPRQHVVVVPAGGGIQSLQQQTGAGLRMVTLLALLVLLIACANIANVLLARGAAHRPENALRMALGESRARLIRRMLTETILLGCLGGLLGLAVGWLVVRSILAVAFPAAHNSAIAATPNWQVLAFALLLSVATGLLFGLAPAWASTHAQPAEALRGIGRTTRDRTRWPQYALVVFQAALSLVLLAGALLMTQSLDNLAHQNFGVVTANRFVLHIDPRGAGYTVATVPGLYRQLDAALSALPGVRAVGMGMYSPLEGDNWGECVIPQGHPAPGPNENCGATWERVNTHFLDSIGVPVISGRGFSDQDTATTQPVAIVNQAFVKRFFPHQDPIGKYFGLDDVKYSGSFEIVGVFRDFKINNPRAAVRPTFLRPLTQYYTGYQEATMKSVEEASMFMSAIVVDFSHPPASADALLRQALANVDPNLTLVDLRTFDAQVAGNFSQDRLMARLSGLFGVLALLLAAVGLYGVTAYQVTRRQGEIGIRMALGASGGDVLAMVLRGVALQLLCGLALGIPAAWLAARWMSSQLYRVGAFDVRALTLAVVVLGISALIAGFLPARRAAALDPAQTLRSE